MPPPTPQVPAPGSSALAGPSSDARAGLRLARWALACATLWAAGLLVAAFVVPVYQGTTTTSSVSTDGGPVEVSTVSTSATLVEVNGPGVLFVVAVPLVVTLLAALLLWRARVPRPALVAAWLLAGALGVFSLLALMSIGVFVLPVLVAVVLACAVRGSGSVSAAASAAPRRVG